MTWVRTGEERENLAHILASHSSNGPVLRGHLALYRALMFGDSPLSRAEREAIAVAVSATNNCHYCTVHHSDALAQASGDTVIAQLVIDGKFDDLGPRLAVMCEYAVALTRDPRHTSEGMLAPMRDAGLTARELIDVNQVVAYFNYVNRVAQGLGVDLEATWPEEVRNRREYQLGNG